MKSVTHACTVRACTSDDDGEWRVCAAHFVDPILSCSSSLVLQLTQLMEDFRIAVKNGDYKEKGYPESAYGMSKVGVSIMTRIFAKQLKNDDRHITVNSGCPGWCKTDMADK
jgi:NAD(P)-dependent dehydrogenase (short-subunit alcohol dehydrogenase family)